MLIGDTVAFSALMDSGYSPQVNRVGALVGDDDGADDGAAVGAAVGTSVGVAVGLSVPRTNEAPVLVKSNVDDRRSLKLLIILPGVLVEPALTTIGLVSMMSTTSAVSDDVTVNGWNEIVTVVTLA